MGEIMTQPLPPAGWYLPTPSGTPGTTPAKVELHDSALSGGATVKLN
jgi:hypothetical protein